MNELDEKFKSVFVRLERAELWHLTDEQYEKHLVDLEADEEECLRRILNE